MRAIDADALIEKCGGWYVEEGTESGFIGTLKDLLATESTIQPETHDKRTETHACDCISRQAAISLPAKPREDRYFQTQSLDDAYDYGWRDLQRCIEKLPPAQQGRKTAAWIAVDYFAYGKPAYREWECSACGCVAEDEKPTWNFCPMCGADMRSERDMYCRKI